MMLGMPSVNPETLESWKAHLRSKVVIVVVVLLLSPKAQLGGDEGRQGSQHPPLTLARRLPPDPTPNLARWITAHGAPSDLASKDLPVMAASDSVSAYTARPTARYSSEFTTGQVNTDAQGPCPTPTLSEPPSQPRALSPDPKSAPHSADVNDKLPRPAQRTVDCPIDFRGRPVCGNATRTPSSLAKRSSELADASEQLARAILSSLSSVRITLSPFTLFCLLFTLLSGVHLAALVLEDSVLRVQMANPLPPDFARGDTWTKRITRLQWRVNLLTQHFALQLLLCGVLASISGWCLFESAAEVDPANNWADVPFGRWLLSTIDDSDVVLRTRNGPYRTLLAIESLSALVALLQPCKHFLPTSILPSSVPPPLALLTSHEPALAVRVDSCWLVSHLVEMTLSLMTLAQLLVLGVKLCSISPFKVAPHLIFHAARGRLIAISNIRMSMNRTVDCLRTVFQVFPDSSNIDEKAEDEEWAVADESDHARRAASLAEPPPLIDMSDVYPGRAPQRRHVLS
ncbi:hypothetical protein OIV83_002863 [Microbotryomycetes sp. JL201]|nr:hypothetical protein OIV83_002863 [Microbotryomycetes sp. JL201]